ncbi:MULTISPECIES: DUF998 domain-containing protein [unclassified Shewanella]|uniref:DUF998 domain-containing protein n=1 Tax=unclassified Shewanella TaxID=196818 RepID=UPI000C7B801B|nr:MULTISPECIES: DUF998 domain-containing protein [unclassified Shewanella]PKG56381.1 hypothetical protein CXF82_14960 [Shewanella sp. GutDb-MelDb]PKG73666.1 hypothetical protein CXF86_16990 [Shewanella sp. GutCb]
MEDKIKYQSMQYDLHRLVVLTIFFGALIAAIGVSISTWAEYQIIGDAVFNRRADVLGDYNHAKLAFVFNIALMITGICIMLAMFGLYLLKQGFFSHYLSLIGGWVGISVLLMGMFPINYLDMHRLVSTSFLLGTVLMYFLCITDRLSQHSVCKGPIFWLSILGFITSSSLVIQLDWNTLDFVPCQQPEAGRCWVAITMWIQTSIVMLWCLSFAWTIRKIAIKNYLELSQRYLTGEQ